MYGMVAVFLLVCNVVYFCVRICCWSWDSGYVCGWFLVKGIWKLVSVCVVWGFVAFSRCVLVPLV